MTRREQGQALVEAVAALPVCLACAFAIVDCGIIVRDRIAVSNAASRAAQAQIAGGDVEQAAERALPAAIRASMVITRDGETIEVSVDSNSRIAALAGRDVTHSSSVEVER